MCNILHINKNSCIFALLKNNRRGGNTINSAMKIMYYPLTETNVKNLMGKKISFTAEGYDANGNYNGVAVIKSVDITKRFPIECECISGDDLRFAILDNHGLETTDGGNTYHMVDHDRCFSYSDRYREVFVKICE